jgi:flagellar FliL protein
MLRFAAPNLFPQLKSLSACHLRFCSESNSPCPWLFFGARIARSFGMGDETAKAVASPANPVTVARVAKRKSSGPLLIGITLLAVTSGGGAAWFVLQRGQSTEASRTTGTNSAPKYLVHLEGFTVNLADAEETHFLRVTMDLGIDRFPEGVDKGSAATLLPVARIRDAILSVLTAGKADALLSPEGKVQLKKNLVESLNHNVPELGIRDVYFTEFLVQR